MAEESFQEKTETATGKKREKAREEGQVVKSAEIASISVLLVGISVLFMFGAYFYPKLVQIMEGISRFQEIPVLTASSAFCCSDSRLSVFCVRAAGHGGGIRGRFYCQYVQVGFHPVEPRPFLPS